MIGGLSYFLLLDKEYWIGLENIYTLTNQLSTPMKLKIIMEDFSGTVKEAYYDSFRIEDQVYTNANVLTHVVPDRYPEA